MSTLPTGFPGARCHACGREIGEIVKLSPAKHKIVRLLGAGMSYAAISDALHISRQTVKQQVNRAVHELGFHTRAELMKWMQYPLFRLGLRFPFMALYTHHNPEVQ